MKDIIGPRWLRYSTSMSVVVVSGWLAAGCATHRQHAESHQHGPACGHAALVHEGHTDYIHDGHLHHRHGSHADEHRLPVSATNPNACAPGHHCVGHVAGHRHGKDCGHQAVPHGDHSDYLVSGHLHHAHSDHCDDHGPVQLAGN